MAFWAHKVELSRNTQPAVPNQKLKKRIESQRQRHQAHAQRRSYGNGTSSAVKIKSNK